MPTNKNSKKTNFIIGGQVFLASIISMSVITFATQTSTTINDSSETTSTTQDDNQDNTQDNTSQITSEDIIETTSTTQDNTQDNTQTTSQVVAQTTTQTTTQATTSSDDNTAGSVQDPLVAKSYVDGQINQLLDTIEELSSIIDTLENNNNSSNNNSDDSNNSNNSNNSESAISSSYVPVQVSAGNTLIGKEGTEIILRSGSGVAVIPVGVSNISDVTTGKDITNNSTVETNHLLITSRDDGRGIKVTASAWFLVKGDYEIQ